MSARDTRRGPSRIHVASLDNRAVKGDHYELNFDPATYAGRAQLRPPSYGHRLTGQAPEEMFAVLTGFLVPYREGVGGLR